MKNPVRYQLGRNTMSGRCLLMTVAASPISTVIRVRCRFASRGVRCCIPALVLICSKPAWLLSLRDPLLEGTMYGELVASVPLDCWAYRLYMYIRLVMTFLIRTRRFLIHDMSIEERIRCNYKWSSKVRKTSSRSVYPSLIILIYI